MDVVVELPVLNGRNGMKLPVPGVRLLLVATVAQVLVQVSYWQTSGPSYWYVVSASNPGGQVDSSWVVPVANALKLLEVVAAGSAEVRGAGSELLAPHKLLAALSRRVTGTDWSLTGDKRQQKFSIFWILVPNAISGTGNRPHRSALS